MARRNDLKVMVRNVPEYVTEEELRPILEEAGALKRIDMWKNARGTHKGYAYVEYVDQESKEAAVRNLNDRSINGVMLKVSPMGGDDERRRARQYEAEQREVPRMELPEDCTSPVAEALRRLPLSQAFEAMQQIKQLAIDNEREATDMLTRFPQISFALMYMLFYIGALDDDPERRQALDEKRKRKRKLLAEEEREKKRQAMLGNAGAPVPSAAGGASRAPERPPQRGGAVNLPPSTLTSVKAPAPAAAPAAPSPAPAAAAAPAPAAAAPAPAPAPTAAAPTAMLDPDIIKQVGQLERDQLQVLVRLTPAEMAHFDAGDRDFALAAQAVVRAHPGKYL